MLESHCHIKYPQLQCKLCKMKTAKYCVGCSKVAIIYPLCQPFVTDRMCWMKHLCNMEHKQEDLKIIEEDYNTDSSEDI